MKTQEETKPTPPQVTPEEMQNYTEEINRHIKRVSDSLVLSVIKILGSVIHNTTQVHKYDLDPDVQRKMNASNQLFLIEAIGMLQRAVKHDASKLTAQEAPYLAKYIPMMKECGFDSVGYWKYLDEIQPALEHHYTRNDHHPEHFEEGVHDMDLVQVLEMVCDWKAASEMQKSGNVYRSLMSCIPRFRIMPEMARVIYNTIRNFYPEEPIPEDFDLYKEKEEA